MSSVPYIELESIESTGTQWINTNIVDYDNEMKMSLRFKIANYSSSTYISAAQNTSYSNTSIGLYLYDGFVTAFKGSTSHSKPMVEIDTTTVYNVDITQTGVIVNNISATFTSSAVSISYPYGIFCANRGGNAVYPSSIILYSYALEKYLGSDLGLKVSLIPVQLISDIPASMSSQGITHSAGEIGMWDKVTNTFFGNSGTGDFIAHYKSNAMALLLRRRGMTGKKTYNPPVNYTRLEYLYSPGGSTPNVTIDTGITLKTSTEIKFGYYAFSIMGGAALGVYEDSSSNFWFGAYWSQHRLYCNNSSINYLTGTATFSDNITISWLGLHRESDNTFVEMSSSVEPRDIDLNIYMYHRNNLDGSNYGKQQAFGFTFFQIRENGTLVFDGLPYLDNENTPCWFDKMTGNTLYNIATGDWGSYAILE